MEAFAWPITVIILGIFGLIFYKKPLERLLDRTTSVSSKGLQATNKPQEALKESKSTTVEDLLKRTFDNALLVEVEEKLKQQLAGLDFKDASEKEKLILRIFASSVIVQFFDRTYYLIYGSQISALQHLNDFRNVPIPVDELITFYNVSKEEEPELYKNVTFENWYAFLIASFLIYKKENVVGITLRGKEFLKYLIEQGYTTLKRG